MIIFGHFFQHLKQFNIFPAVLIHIRINFLSILNLFFQNDFINTVTIVNLTHLFSTLKEGTLQKYQCSLKNSTFYSIFHCKISHFLWWIKELIWMIDSVIVVNQKRMHDFYRSIMHNDNSV